ncbi:MAG: type IV secretion protein DotI [Legionellales bacterium]|nr:type IV secretion protein DotI [Legionellales bacterium]
MDEKAAELVFNRNFFYRDNYKRVVSIGLVSIISNVVLVLATAYSIVRPAPAKFIVTSADGRIIPVEPLSAAVKSTPQILAWANMAATKINSFDFVNYRQQLQEASSYFTAEGWQDFRRQLVASGNVKYVVENRLVVTSVATGAPVVNNQGLINGTYTWNVTLPILVKYAGATITRNIPQTVTMLIQRVSIQNNPQGIGIASYRAR